LQAFQQYDIEDEGIVDARFMLDCIKKFVKGSSPHSDLESSIRMLQMCPLTPGKWNSSNYSSAFSEIFVGGCDMYEQLSGSA
jgi:hypothetical protein